MKRIIASLVLGAFLFSFVGCANKAQSGAGLGALAGATVGALTAKNKVSGAAIGAGIGLLLGYMVGNEMDKYDREQISNTLEHQPSGKPMAWQNPDNGNKYEATPSPAYVQNDKIYRDITIKANVNGQEKDVKAKAYRDSDGTWTLVQ